MKAGQINSYGGQEAVQYIESAVRPVANEGQVLVAVRAAGINPFDYKVREGLTRQMGELQLPATLGGDVAGVVAEIGPGVNGFELGEAVYGQAGALSGQGSFAEFTPVKAAHLAPKPRNADFVTAAALPLVSVSAYQALVDHINLQTGQKILIHGGAGGIGSMAIQLAKHLGAYVATTASATDAAFVKDLGADEFIDYQAQDFAALVHGYDAVYDMVGGETNARSYGVLKPGGTLVSMVAPVNEAMAGQFDVHYINQFTQVTAESLTQVTKLVDSGVLHVNVDKVFPLLQVAEALEYLKTGHPHGKVVVQVSDTQD